MRGKQRHSRAIIMTTQTSSLCIILFNVFGLTASRQMCISCQYVDNPTRSGIECASAPWNWTFGETRMRCNFKCTISGQFNKKSGNPVFFYRGCSSNNDVEKDGCQADDNTESCFYSCEMSDYCNDRSLASAPSKVSSATRIGICVSRVTILLTLISSLYVYAIDILLCCIK